MEFASERVKKSIEKVEKKIIEITGNRGELIKKEEERINFTKNIFEILDKRKKIGEDIAIVFFVVLPKEKDIVVIMKEEDNTMIKIKSRNSGAIAYNYWGAEVLWALSNKGSLLSRIIDHIIEYQDDMEVIVK